MFFFSSKFSSSSSMSSSNNISNSKATYCGGFVLGIKRTLKSELIKISTGGSAGIYVANSVFGIGDPFGVYNY